MRYATYDAYGRITSTGSCPDSYLPLLENTRGAVFVLDDDQECRDDTHYIDVENSVVVAMGEKPSLYHEFNYITHSWIDPRDLSQVKAARVAYVNYERSKAEYGGFTWDSNVFDSDLESVIRIGVQARAAELNPAFSTDWTLLNNSVITLDATDMLAVEAALAAHVDNVHAIARGLKVDIADAEDVTEVNAVVWPT